MVNLLTAIVNKFEALPANTLHTALGGRLYFQQASQVTTYPYGVYNVVTNNPDYYFKGNDEDVIIDFHFYSQKPPVQELTGIYTACKSLFDDCKLTITGYTHYIFERGTTQWFPDIEEGTNEVVVEYSIKMEKL